MANRKIITLDVHAAPSTASTGYHTGTQANVEDIGEIESIFLSGGEEVMKEKRKKQQQMADPELQRAREARTASLIAEVNRQSATFCPLHCLQGIHKGWFYNPDSVPFAPPGDVSMIESYFKEKHHREIGWLTSIHVYFQHPEVLRSINERYEKESKHAGRCQRKKRLEEELDKTTRVLTQGIKEADDEIKAAEREDKSLKVSDLM
jgi:predicted ribosome quality control (RQC) complex YloA/Tae2 family protein